MDPDEVSTKPLSLAPDLLPGCLGSAPGVFALSLGLLAKVKVLMN